MPDVIESFSGEYRFLSNFAICTPPGVTLQHGLCGDYPHYFRTTEHAFQASKTNDNDERDAIRRAASPGDAKRMGRRVKLRADWEQVKDQIMLHLLLQKFQHDPMRQLLLDTGEAELIEGNTWNDTYWGVCRGKGRNELGKLLVLVRYQLNHPETYPNVG